MRIIFFGTSKFACLPLVGLINSKYNLLAIITKPDRPAGRGYKLTRSPVALLADQLGLIIKQPRQLKEITKEIFLLKPELLVVVGFGQKIPKAILDIAPLGAINLHPSLLPVLRGASPIHQAIIQGFKYTGITIFYLDQKLDTGDIILQESIQIDPQDTTDTLSKRLGLIGTNLLIHTIGLIKNREAPRIPQNHNLATYAPSLTKSVGKIDWLRPAYEIDLLIRGTDPWPGAYTFLAGKPLKLFSPTKIFQKNNNAIPGTIVTSPNNYQDYLCITCGIGVLGINEIQAAGKRRLKVNIFLHGNRLVIGDLLGK